jgi:hypothetical protein
MAGEKILSRNHDHNSHSRIAPFKRSKDLGLPSLSLAIVFAVRLLEKAEFIRIANSN